MRSIQTCEVPEGSLLARYRAGGGYADCFAVGLDRAVGLAEYVEAFYTTPLFRTERVILRVAIARPSTDDEARRLAAGTLDAFAAWRVEGRTADELLMCDVYGRTRSWLSVRPAAGGTRLYFGSAVVPVIKRGRPTLGWSFHVLLGFHRLYSRLLLASAKMRLQSPRARA